MFKISMSVLDVMTITDTLLAQQIMSKYAIMCYVPLEPEKRLSNLKIYGIH